MQPQIKQFMDELKELPLVDATYAERFYEELQDHIEDSMHDFHIRGDKDNDAATHALAKIGSPKKLQRQFNTILKPRRISEKVHIALSIFLSLMGMWALFLGLSPMIDLALVQLIPTAAQYIQPEGSRFFTILPYVIGLLIIQFCVYFFVIGQRWEIRGIQNRFWGTFVFVIVIPFVIFNFLVVAPILLDNNFTDPILYRIHQLQTSIYFVIGFLVQFSVYTVAFFVRAAIMRKALNESKLIKKYMRFWRIAFQCIGAVLAFLFSLNILSIISPHTYTIAFAPFIDPFQGVVFSKLSVLQMLFVPTYVIKSYAAFVLIFFPSQHAIWIMILGILLSTLFVYAVYHTITAILHLFGKKMWASQKPTRISWVFINAGIISAVLLSDATVLPTRQSGPNFQTQVVSISDIMLKHTYGPFVPLTKNINYLSGSQLWNITQENGELYIVNENPNAQNEYKRFKVTPPASETEQPTITEAGTVPFSYLRGYTILNTEIRTKDLACTIANREEPPTYPGISEEGEVMPMITGLMSCTTLKWKDTVLYTHSFAGQAEHTFGNYELTGIAIDAKQEWALISLTLPAGTTEVRLIRLNK